jgi:Condensation domain
MEVVLMISQGPMSWQQAVNLRRDALLGIQTGNSGLLMTLPPDEPISAVYDRLVALVRDEDALRIVKLPLGGNGLVDYEDEIELPVFTERAEAAEQVTRRSAELRQARFASSGGPLWKLVIFEHPDEAGRPARTGCVILDHHIADGRSTVVFGDRIAGRADAAISRASYRDWVDWQLENFPMQDTAQTPRPARDFWRQYFAGSAPNRPTVLPGCDPTSTLCGLEHIMTRDLPTSTQELRGAAGTLRTTPFLLFAASVISTISSLTQEDDIAYRYVTHGRIPRFLDTIGWFSDNMPIRARGESLADPMAALSAVTSGRQEMLEFEMTPFGYILAACEEKETETPQVVINFIMYDNDRILYSGPDDETIHGSRGTLNLTVGVPSRGTGWVECRFDPKRFTRDGVEDFLQITFEHLRRVVAT